MFIAGREWKVGQRGFFPFFCAGLLAGIFIMNMGKSILLEGTGLFDEDTLCRMKYITVDGNALFCFIFRKRIVRLLILAVLSTTYLGMAAYYGMTFWYGTSAGAFLAALTMRYGFKGILLAFVSMFPQYLVYIPAVLALLSWCESTYRGIYTRGAGRPDKGDRAFLLKKAGQLGAILCAAALGCLLEAYLNPGLLLGFLKIF